jgi:hypothetical protein
MSQVFANTKLFGAAAILFAVATIFNVNMNASASSSDAIGLKVAPAMAAEPVLQVGPTFPPSPWDDDAPSVAASVK